MDSESSKKKKKNAVVACLQFVNEGIDIVILPQHTTHAYSRSSLFVSAHPG